MPSVSVRYFVDDVDAAIEFYTERLGFEEVMHPAPAFAMLALGELRLLLSAPGGGPGGGKATPDGRLPQPGGWNRFQIEVEDLEAAVATLSDQGAGFRNEIVEGVGGKQIGSIDGVLLANAVTAVLGLVVLGGRPVELQERDIGGLGQSQSLAGHLDRADNQLVL